MKPEDIKTAFGKIADQERIPMIIADIEGNAPMVIRVISCADKTLNIPADHGASIRAATVAYLKDLAQAVDADLVRLGVDSPDEFEATLNDLVKDAEPNGDSLPS